MNTAHLSTVPHTRRIPNRRLGVLPAGWVGRYGSVVPNIGKTPAMQSFSKWGVFWTSKRMHGRIFFGKTPWWSSLRRRIWFAVNVLWQHRAYFPDCSVTALLLRRVCLFRRSTKMPIPTIFWGGAQYPAIKKFHPVAESHRATNCEACWTGRIANWWLVVHSRCHGRSGFIHSLFLRKA